MIQKCVWITFSVVDKCGIFVPTVDDKLIELDNNNGITQLWLLMMDQLFSDLQPPNILGYNLSGNHVCLCTDQRLTHLNTWIAFIAEILSCFIFIIFQFF